MLYVVLYLVCGVIAFIAMVVHTCNTYEGLGYDIESASDEINVDLKEHYSWKYWFVVVVDLVCVIGLWPVILVKAFKNYITLLNAYLEPEENEYLEEEES